MKSNLGRSSRSCSIRGQIVFARRIPITAAASRDQLPSTSLLQLPRNGSHDGSWEELYKESRPTLSSPRSITISHLSTSSLARFVSYSLTIEYILNRPCFYLYCYCSCVIFGLPSPWDWENRVAEVYTLATMIFIPYGPTCSTIIEHCANIEEETKKGGRLSTWLSSWIDTNASRFFSMPRPTANISLVTAAQYYILRQRMQISRQCSR
jgi:hypothetical protein